MYELRVVGMTIGLDPLWRSILISILYFQKYFWNIHISRFSIITFEFYYLLKSSQNKKDLNDVTAAPFSVVFFAARSWEKGTKMGQLWCHWSPSYCVTTLGLWKLEKYFMKTKMDKRRIYTPSEMICTLFWTRYNVLYIKRFFRNLSTELWPWTDSCSTRFWALLLCTTYCELM